MPPKHQPNNATSRSAPMARAQTLISSQSRFNVRSGPKKMPGSISISGHEYLSAVSTTAGTVGLNLSTIFLNPLSFANTRLLQYAVMFDKFLFKNFTLHYSSADPSTATGQYIIAFARDYADNTPTANDAGIRAYFAMAGSKISSVWESTSFRVPLSSGQDFYYCNDSGFDGRLVFQGQIYMAVVSGTTFHGSLWIEYDVDFYDPQIDQASLDILESKQDVEVGFVFNAFDSALKYLDSRTENVLSGVRTVLSSGVTWHPDADTGFTPGKNLVIPPGRYLLNILLGDNGSGDTVGFPLSAFRYTDAVKKNNNSPVGPPADSNISDSVIEQFLVLWPASGFGSSSYYSFIVNIATSLGPILFSLGVGNVSDTTILPFGQWMFSLVNIGANLALYDATAPLYKEYTEARQNGTIRDLMEKRSKEREEHNRDLREKQLAKWTDNPEGKSTSKSQQQLKRTDVSSPGTKNKS